MPEILTMIQVKRMTPAPAVLFMSFLSLVYLGSSNISGLISYVGFATWVRIRDKGRVLEGRNTRNELGMVSFWGLF